MAWIKLDDTHLRVTRTIMLTVLIVLSAGLMSFIGYDTLKGISYVEDGAYLHFQFCVCIVFIIEYFLQGAIAPKPLQKLGKTILFLVVSLPYLNVISWLGIEVDPTVGYYLRYVPLLRGAYVMALLVGLVSKNPAISMFWSYLAVIVLSVFFASVIFFDREGAVNPRINDYGSSLWWCAMQTTTVGMPFDPMTPVGKILAASLSAMGMMMFPLFTVYVTALVKKYMQKLHPTT